MKNEGHDEADTTAAAAKADETKPAEAKSEKDAPGREVTGNPEVAEIKEPTAEEKAEAEAEAAKSFEAGYKGEPVPDKAAEPVKPAVVVDEDFVNGVVGKEASAVRAEFAKLRDTLFGKIGEANRSLKDLQARGTLKITKDKLKRVSEQYGDELADVLAQDLSEALGSAAAAPATAPAAAAAQDEALKTMLGDLEHRITMDVERKALKRQHKDFYDVIETEPFKAWLEQQPEDVRAEWPQSMDSDWLGERMTEYKKHQEALKRAADKNKRLETSIQPKGTKPAPVGMSDNDAFTEGFRSARGGR